MSAGEKSGSADKRLEPSSHPEEPDRATSAKYKSRGKIYDQCGTNLRDDYQGEVSRVSGHADLQRSDRSDRLLGEEAGVGSNGVIYEIGSY